MAKNNKPASAYAKPHTMSGKSVKVEANPGSGFDGSMLANNDITLGNIARPVGRDVKTSGIKMRGAGAATKGVMSRGPMA